MDWSKVAAIFRPKAWGGRERFKAVYPRGHAATMKELLQGYLAHKKTPPPLKDHHRALGIVLLSEPEGGHFLVSEIRLYGSRGRQSGSSSRLEG